MALPALDPDCLQRWCIVWALVTDQDETWSVGGLEVGVQVEGMGSIHATLRFDCFAS
jgi:hypothetical protein